MFAHPFCGRQAVVTHARNRDQLNALNHELALAFASAQMDDARRLTAQLQYLQRIHEEMDSQTPVV